MSQSQRNVSSSGFEGVKVSKGFVRGLQGQVFKLEQNQQDMITQLEHANALVAEFHETSVMYQRKYDEALRQMEEMRCEHGYEKAILNYNLEAANEETERERERNQVQSEQIARLEHQLANQCDITQTQTLQSQATTTIIDMDMDMETGSDSREELSPVSVSLPSPRTPMAPRARRGQTPTLDPETPEPVTPSRVSAPTTSPFARSFQFQYQCSPAMACCDGLYEPNKHGDKGDKNDEEWTPAKKESDHEAYWKEEYPKWVRSYCEEMKKQETQKQETQKQETQ